MPMPLLGWIVTRAALPSMRGFLARRGIRQLGANIARSRFGRWAFRAGDFLMLGALSWIYDNVLNATNIWGTVQTATYAIANFDWNQSDQSIKDQINQNNTQIAGLLGRFAGSGLVRLTAVGAAYGAKLLYPVVAGRIAVALAEDTSGQLRNDFVALVEGMRSLVLENALWSMVLTFRSRRWFGMEPRAEGTPAYTFASEVTRRVEQIRHPLLRSFVEGLLGGAEDAFWDVGYIIAGTVDDMVAANRYAQAQQFGPDKAIIVTPDTRAPDEKLVLSGSQRFVEQNLDAVLANHKLVHNRDVGQIVGQPAEDWVRAGLQLRKLTIVFKSKETPPWVAPPGQPRIREATYSVPEPDLNLTWQKIKTAATHYTWGRFRATANLSNGRQMAVYGATARDAETKLKELLTLGTGEILTLSVSEEKERHVNLRKNPTEMYPAYATLLIRRPTSEDAGANDLAGNNYSEELRRIELWPDTAPENLPPLR